MWKSEATGNELCETATHFICRKPVATGGREEVFRVGRLLCRKELPREQIVKIAEAGKTDLFEDFISRFNRPFSAYLTLDPKEENPRPPRPLRVSPAPRAEGEGGKGGRKKASVDFTGAVAIGKSEVHGGAEIVQTSDSYYVTKPAPRGAPRRLQDGPRDLQEASRPAKSSACSPTAAASRSTASSPSAAPSSPPSSSSRRRRTAASSSSER